MYGKATETAIAAMSRLAEAYDGGVTRLSATEIAQSRGLQRPFLGKILSSLSQAGLIEGTRGPGGGFTFTRPPKEVTLYEVYAVFEREETSKHCPFGGGICGTDDNCPLHDRMEAVDRAMDKVLHKTDFDVFHRSFTASKGKANWRLGDSSSKTAK
ncbi:MAG: RrF2 family transcriptional regulator [Rubripirellula sp.]